MTGSTYRTVSLAALVLAILGSAASASDKPQKLSVDQEGFSAAYYPGQDAPQPIGILVLGGSEGGQPVFLARPFANAGYPVLSLAYFRQPGVPDHLDRIPLEYFQRPLSWFSEQPDMQGKRIIIAGASKGAELALLLASHDSSIAGVIAVAPSSVVFQGIPQEFWPPHSSWTQKGRELPFVPYDVSQGVDPRHLRPLYERSLSHEDLVSKASIPVEKIEGPILLLSGKDDRMWPAAEMAASIVERLKKHKFRHAYSHINYQDAGHTLNEYFMIGGTRAGNQRARTESWQAIRTFLADSFSPTKGN